MGSIVSNVTGMFMQGAQYDQDKANVTAARLMQSANNNLEASNAALTNWARSVNNQRALNAAGDAHNAASTTAARWADNLTKGTVQQQVQTSEEMGRVAVAAAAAGQGGGSVRRIQDQMRRANAVQTQRVEEAAASTRFDMADAKDSIMTNAIAGLDNRQAFGNYDFTQYVDPAKPDSLGKSLLTGGLSGIILGVPVNSQAMVRSAEQGQSLAGAVQFGQSIGNSMKQAFDIAKQLAV